MNQLTNTQLSKLFATLKPILDKKDGFAHEFSYYHLAKDDKLYALNRYIGAYIEAPGLTKSLKEALNIQEIDGVDSDVFGYRINEQKTQAIIDLKDYRESMSLVRLSENYFNTSNMNSVTDKYLARIKEDEVTYIGYNVYSLKDVFIKHTLPVINKVSPNIDFNKDDGFKYFSDPTNDNKCLFQFKHDIKIGKLNAKFTMIGILQRQATDVYITKRTKPVKKTDVATVIHSLQDIAEKPSSTREALKYTIIDEQDNVYATNGYILIMYTIPGVYNLALNDETILNKSFSKDRDGLNCFGVVTKKTKLEIEPLDGYPRIKQFFDQTDPKPALDVWEDRFHLDHEFVKKANKAIKRFGIEYDPTKAIASNNTHVAGGMCTFENVHFKGVGVGVTRVIIMPRNGKAGGND